MDRKKKKVLNSSPPLFLHIILYLARLKLNEKKGGPIDSKSL